MTLSSTISKSRILGVISGLLLCLTTSLLSAAEVKPTLRILTHEVFPVSYQDKKTKKLTGFATKYLTDILKQSGIDYTIEMLPWSRAYNVAIKEPNTLLYGIARIEEREEFFIWFEELFSTDYALFGLTDYKRLNTQDIEDIKKRPIGVIRNHVNQTSLRKNGFVNVIEANSNEHLLRLLLNKRVDYISISTTRSELANIKETLGIEANVITQQVELPFLKYSIYYAFNSETDSEIISSMNTALMKLKEDPNYLRPRPRLPKK